MGGWIGGMHPSMLFDLACAATPPRRHVPPLPTAFPLAHHLLFRTPLGPEAVGVAETLLSCSQHGGSSLTSFAARLEM
jgi:hypothetical protein